MCKFFEVLFRASSNVTHFKRKYWQATWRSRPSLSCEWTQSSHADSDFPSIHSPSSSFIHNINYSISWLINFYLFFEVQTNIFRRGKIKRGSVRDEGEKKDLSWHEAVEFSRKKSRLRLWTATEIVLMYLRETNRQEEKNSFRCSCESLSQSKRAGRRNR